MKLAEKFGWRMPYATALESLPGPWPEASLPNFGDEIWSYKSRHDFVADCALLEGDLQQAVNSAKEVVRASLDYFFGKWRQTSGREDGDPYDWFNNGSMALFWASWLNDWESLASLSQFPRPQPKWEWPDHAYFALLGFFIRGEKLGEHQRTIEYVLSKKKEGMKLLLECLLALECRDPVRFQTAWETYMAYFKKRERKKDRPDLLRSKNGSFYVYAAKHYHVPLTVPEQFVDFVVSPPAQ